ncbi:NHL repeat-containing protein, partial [Singulisphaera rosea]
SDSQALSLATLPDGRVFVGTGPSGLLVDISNPKAPITAPRLTPEIKYLWDLATDTKGNLYAATGPTGQLWKISPDGTRTLLLDSPHSHLLCVAIGPDGSVYAGSDGEGLIYRVSAEGKTSVVYDAPQSEVRTLLFTPEGVLYAGTAAEAGGGGGSGRGNSLFTGGGLTALDTKIGAVMAAQEPPKPSASPTPSSNPPPTVGGSANPKPAAAGDNAVYRIGPDGVPREVFRSRVLIFSLARQGDRLLVGTGPEGQLFEVRDQGHAWAPIAKLDHGQILSMIPGPQDALLIGTGDPGAIIRLDSGYVASGTIVSDVLDTKLISRFGALTWRAEQPEGTTVALQMRTGNVGEPDSTWSPWSSEQTDPEGAKAGVPPGRFAQYRATLSTRDSSKTPELRSVAIRHQSVNLPPEIVKVEVPDVTAADGTTRQTKLNLRWEVTDPNSDELSYTVHLRKEGWPDWIRIGPEQPITASSLEWDTTAVPDGHYRVRLTASDRLSNNPDDVLTVDRTSDVFAVDHQSPEVSIAPKSRGAVITLQDRSTRLVKAAYALDGGEWTPIFPEDGLYDSPRETMTLSLPDLKPGFHILMVRATDAAGNVGTNDALIDTR